MRPACFPYPAFPDYALLDSGGGEKLERFGAMTLRRPDPQALWRPRLAEEEWRRADLAFVRDPTTGGRAGDWEAGPVAPGAVGADGEWPCRFGDATFLIRPTPFKHVGLFPEQAANWAFVAGLRDELDEARPKLLNLFGYTGAASILAVQAGYEVTHVDASKTAIQWARDNAAASGLPRDAMRVICDDALAFARREVRRGAKYHGIYIDPPHYGRGPKGEKWQFEEGIAAMVEAAGSLLAPRSFLILSAYAIGTSPLALAGLMAAIEDGRVEAGELALPEAGPAGTGRLLPAGFCARLTRGIGTGSGG